jgi:hypothetical protein
VHNVILPLPNPSQSSFSLREDLAHQSNLMVLLGVDVLIDTNCISPNGSRFRRIAEMLKRSIEALGDINSAIITEDLSRLR